MLNQLKRIEDISSSSLITSSWVKLALQGVAAMNLLYPYLPGSRINHKEEYWIAMALELIPVEPQTILFAMNYSPTYLYPLLSVQQVTVYDI